MILLKELVEFLDEHLEINSIHEKALNGLQVEGSQEVKNIAFAVDITINSISKAIENDCNVIICHHPFIYNPIKKITGITAKRIELLIKNGISVYVAHLPMDLHKKYSHSSAIAEEIGLYGISKFGLCEKNYFGVSGYFKKKTTLDELKQVIDKKLQTECKTFLFGKKEISTIGIVAGAGGFSIEEADKNNIDCIITGEMHHHELMSAKDYKINVILAGHFQTEKLGMIKLSRTITKKFRAQTFFFDS